MCGLFAGIKKTLRNNKVSVKRDSTVHQIFVDVVKVVVVFM